MKNKKPYGHAGEWEPSIGGFTCDCCKEKKGEYYKEEVHLCQSCYDRYVTPAPAETPEKRPITEWSDDLVGATVEALVDVNQVKRGDQFKVIRKWNDDFADLIGTISCVMKFKNLTIIKKADEARWDETNNQDIRKDLKEAVDGMRTPKTRTECTHSAELEFPNGERVKIPPPPDSEGWEAVAWVWGRDSRYYWAGPEQINFAGHMFTHGTGQMMFLEYHSRAAYENPRIVSLTKWARELVDVPIEVTVDLGLDDTRKKRVNSTWPQRHPSGGVKYGEE